MTSLLTLGDVASAATADPAEAVSNAALAASDAAAGAAVSSATAVQAATDAATEAVKSDGGGGGFFGPFAWAFESSLKARRPCISQPACHARWWRQAVLTGGAAGVAQVLDSGLSMLHVPYSYGFAIILLTIIVKALTFPLSRKQARCVPLPTCRPLCCVVLAELVQLLCVRSRSKHMLTIMALAAAGGEHGGDAGAAAAHQGDPGAVQGQAAGRDAGTLHACLPNTLTL